MVTMSRRQDFFRDQTRQIRLGDLWPENPAGSWQQSVMGPPLSGRWVLVYAAYIIMW
jgi:hypothetical protein